ncbi:hypothetical protein LOC71_16800 [Rhodopirellula sp. JC740]|uniref:Uncharacterized protein n=1 Tax=Rhodopirellula halodulae TaxID=2894198 RepID=A0ABS8NK66_9BACT|nr:MULTISPECIES: hypothetical protein [unclassified Rhodopirellula]MCC9643943.1 hypothetical protein [Rhodopirellula sp. JC740]MCC9657107.1 hypothetical protein [Rhodopirellula sp. JC737]
MWRSLFMAVGIMMVILGVETMLIDSATVYAAAESSAVEFMDPGVTPAQTTKVWTPSERFPWVMLAIGAVVILYAITLPKRWGRGGE